MKYVVLYDAMLKTPESTAMQEELCKCTIYIHKTKVMPTNTGYDQKQH